MHNEAQRVTEGTMNTYNEEMRSKLGDAFTQTANIEDEALRLTKIREILGQWMDDYTAYKSVQIANHEALKAYQQGLFAHDVAHAPETMYDDRW
jgi:hypothetical protein